MSQYQRYFVFDEPIPYKSLLLYPVRIRDYYDFLYLATCLMLEKNSIRDPIMAVKAISMSYLEYMYEISGKDNNFISLFVGLMAIVLNRKDDKDFEIRFYYDENKKPLFKIDNEVFNSEDFDNLRQIIAEQNSLDLPDERIQKDVRDALEEAQRFKQKISNSKTANFEEQLIALALYSGWALDKIYELTVRKFIMSIQRANHMIMSNIYLTASMSGFVTFKDKSILRGWLADTSISDKYSDVKITREELSNKISGNKK